MFANNETGVIQPIPELSAIAKANGALFHTDAVQALATPPRPKRLRPNRRSRSAVALRSQDVRAAGNRRPLRTHRVKLAPLFHGGTHERQRRAGTENVAGIVALGKAAELAAIG